MSDDDENNFVSGALSSVEGIEHLDEDTIAYVSGVLSDDPFDEDARGAIRDLMVDALSEESGVDGVSVCESFFALLDLNHPDNKQQQQNGTINNSIGSNSSAMDEPGEMRKLTQTITMKEQDVETFAMGLRVEEDHESGTNFYGSAGSTSKIAAFYANMIDPEQNENATSERNRRKARQKELRIKAEEEERQRAIDEAMVMFKEMRDGEDAADLQANEQRLSSSSSDGNNNGSNNATLSDESQMRDVSLLNFDLPNLRGGGPNLLSGANLILARGRRYGLMGRNGCGKTTFLTALSKRQIDCDDQDGGVPTNVRMLLVRQEIIGSDWSAVDTVLKSDVQRESCKKYIAWVDRELDKIDNPDTATATATDNNNSNDNDNKGDETTDGKNDGEPTDAPSKSKTKESAKERRQRLKDRKKLTPGQRKALKANKKTNKSATNNTADVSTMSESQKDDRRKKLREQLVRAHQRMSEIEQLEGGDPEPRARKVLAGLGFTKEMQDKPTSALSGGWRMRVSLSCALFANPSLLLLDEPTNHLDLEAVLWLERYLTQSFTGTLVVVSHDRHFLNEVVTDVVHFHKSTLATYRGDITNYESVVIENKIRHQRLREQQEAKRAHLQRYIDLHAQSGENGVKASKQRKSRMKKLDKIGVMAQDGKRWKASYDGDAQEVEEVEEEEEVVLNFPDPGSFDKDMIKLEQVKFGYHESNILLEGVDMTVDLSSRIALLGRNGCGKSTLVKLCVGGLKPLSGEAKIDPRCKIEYLAQHQLEQLDPDGTPLSTMVDRYPGDRSNTHIGELRRYLANFGLGGIVLPVQKIHTMSGGQKCRLCLACAMYRKPHLLVLDEPTNHLDLETTEALIEAIRNFKGGVLLVSHDQHLLTSVCKDLLVVENRKVQVLKGGRSNKDAFEDYKKQVVSGRR
uniref:ABC transporter domain-containing protein n=2 Tax=Pseudo-nitzschia australis TaxID=44445 RepID=A0A7S4ABI0_9STRA|mmetsp:Transcript_27380/g.60292  ORF Transcript_27380/g.60292 Transcript_27380/m.60292 type:complete len:914 (-) Transcript_27380:1874-4615(-)